MTKRRRPHLLPGAVLVAGAALVAVGCSADGDTGAGLETTEAATNDAVTLDGVRFDVRRDPG